MALDEKHLPDDLQPDPELLGALKLRLDPDGTLGCAAAHVIAEERGIEPIEVGRCADAARIHLSRCQLGLYGYPGHAKGWGALAEGPLPEGLEAGIRAAAVDGRVGCPALWAAAARFGVSRLRVGFVADRLGMKIVGCGLGAFR
jgi:hypothetical protein